MKLKELNNNILSLLRTKIVNELLPTICESVEEVIEKDFFTVDSVDYYSLTVSVTCSEKTEKYFNESTEGVVSNNPQHERAIIMYIQQYQFKVYFVNPLIENNCENIGKLFHVTISLI